MGHQKRIPEPRHILLLMPRSLDLSITCNDILADLSGNTTQDCLSSPWDLLRFHFTSIAIGWLIVQVSDQDVHTNHHHPSR